jgi:phytoene synthase
MTGMEARARETAQWQMLAFHARSFRWAAAFLSREQRRKVAALYAFCRVVDDIADGPGATPAGYRDLERLQSALETKPEREVLWPERYRWFRALCIECGIELDVVRELVVGMASDLRPVRLQSDRELLRYCYRAAGTVGLMMCAVLGVRDPRASRHAIDLGIAMQLTNIARDVLEDAQASRVYLPAGRLRLYGVEPEDLVRGEADPEAVSLVVGEVLTIAEDFYQSGDVGMRFLPPRARWAVLIASRLYRGIGRRLRRRYQSNPLMGRVIVPWFEKVGLVVSASLSWLRLSLRPPRTRSVEGYGDYAARLSYAAAAAAADSNAGPGAHAGADADTDRDSGAVSGSVVSTDSHAVGHTH